MKIKSVLVIGILTLSGLAHASADRLGPVFESKDSAGVYAIGLQHLQSAKKDRRYMVTGYAILEVASKLGSQDAAQGMAMIHSLVDSASLQLSAELVSRIVASKNPDDVVERFLSAR